jgi:hypothetical protein
MFNTSLKSIPTISMIKLPQIILSYNQNKRIWSYLFVVTACVKNGIKMRVATTSLLETPMEYSNGKRTLKKSTNYALRFVFHTLSFNNMHHFCAQRMQLDIESI